MLLVDVMVGLSGTGRVLNEVIGGVLATPDTHTSVEAEAMLTPGQFIERVGGCGLRGWALHEHAFVIAAVLPAWRRADIFKQALTQCLPDFALGDFCITGFDDKILETGDVVGVGTVEQGHDSIGWLVVGFDFNLVAVREQLGTEAERFALQREIDKFDGPVRLGGGRAMRDLVGIEL